jgi:hypothetical protein
MKAVPGYQERMDAKEKRRNQTKLEVAMIGAQGRNRRDEEWYNREEYKRSVGTPAQMADARETLAYLPELQSLARGLQREDIEIPAGWEAGADLARSFGPLGSSAAAGIERVGLNPASIRWLERGRQAESDIIRLASGLAVTGFELENIKKWSPWAGNLTKGQRTDRHRNIYNKLGRQAKAVMGDAWTDMPSERFTHVGDAPPAPQVTPGQMPQVPEAGAGRIITPEQIPPGQPTPPQMAPPQVWPGWTPEQMRLYQEMRGSSGG